MKLGYEKLNIIFNMKLFLRTSLN